MLKKKIRLFLGLIVLTGSAYVTPTYASSAFSPVVLSYIQPSGLSGAKDEVIVLHNNTNNFVDITHWCISNKTIKIYCFDPIDGQSSSYRIPAYGDLVAISKFTAETYPDEARDKQFIFSSVNQTSGSMTASSDTVTLKNQDVVLDSYSWKTPASTGNAHHRTQLTADPLVFNVTNLSTDWYVAPITPMPSDTTEVITQTAPVSGQPADGETDGQSSSSISKEDMPLITELLPNPSGVDEGREFIELFNPNETKAVSLKNIKIIIGETNVKVVTFTDSDVLAPREYRAFFNSSGSMFSLGNTTGKVQLIYRDEPVGAPIEYSTAKDDQAWALIGTSWQYTNVPTPSAANTSNSMKAVEDPTLTHTSEETQLKPCPDGQYRNLITHRCRKNVETSAVKSVAACKEGYERNIETGRCRKAAVQQATLVACKQGQERSTETNRCRTVAKMATADHGIKEARAVKSAGVAWYAWLGIVLIIMAILSYGIWEWRAELHTASRKLFKKFARRDQ